MKKLILIVLPILLATACVTQKKKGEASGVKKFYHDLTAEFNGYFNATEILKATTAQLSIQEPDNYNQILPIYPYVKATNPRAAAGELDEAIKKVTIVTALHQPSHWVDDCYLVAGKAQYLKQDYESAEETFEYLVSEFSPEAKLAKEKSSKSSKPKSAAEVQKVRKQKEKERVAKSKEREKTAAQKRKAYNKAKKQKEREREKARKQGKPVPRPPKQEEGEGTTPTPEKKEPELSAKQKKQEEKKKKKEAAEEKKALEDDDNDKPFKHKPAYQDGQLWLLRTYIERGKYDQANYIMRQLYDNKKIRSDVAHELFLATAYYYIRRREYASAIAPLDKAVQSGDNRILKARYAFILAQLYEMQGQHQEAYKNYQQAVKFRPAYEMDFNARLSMVINQYQSGSVGKEQAVSSLEAFLKDEKNIDYLDRIYFSIAEVYLKSGQEDKAVAYLELAINEGNSSKSQRVETNLKLARIYYQSENYLKASDAYGKALVDLPKTDNRYPEVERLSSSLREIAIRLETIQKQDSLLRIADMSIDEKRAFAVNRKREMDEQRRKAAIDAAKQGTNAAPLSRPALAGQTPTQLTSNSTSKYWAYNDRAVKKGQRDFEREWGGRILEDNWRKSNRAGASIAGNEVANVNESSAGNLGLLDAQVVDMLRGVPQSKAQMDQANEMIADAMFELGVLYRNNLENFRKSIDILEQLLVRYPNSKHIPEALYYLHLMHKNQGNTGKAEEYQQRLVRDYPNSVFAKILTDPNFVNTLNQKERDLTQFYDETYALFNARKYEETSDRLQQVAQRFGKDHALQARFALLQAMTTGALQGVETYVAELQKIVAAFPNTDEQKRAREILRLLGERSTPTALGQVSSPDAQESESQFTYEPDKMHYIIITVSSDDALTDAKIAVSNFNRKYYQAENLRISNIYLTPEGQERIPVIVIRRYDNAEKAMEYFKSTLLNRNDFIKDKFEIYPITQTNYQQVIRNRSLGSYRDFFNSNYKN